MTSPIRLSRSLRECSVPMTEDPTSPLKDQFPSSSGPGTLEQNDRDLSSSTTNLLGVPTASVEKVILSEAGDTACVLTSLGCLGFYRLDAKRNSVTGAAWLGVATTAPVSSSNTTKLTASQLSPGGGSPSKKRKKSKSGLSSAAASTTSGGFNSIENDIITDICALPTKQAVEEASSLVGPRQFLLWAATRNNKIRCLCFNPSMNEVTTLYEVDLPDLPTEDNLLTNNNTDSSSHNNHNNSMSTTGGGIGLIIPFSHRIAVAVSHDGRYATAWEIDTRTVCTRDGAWIPLSDHIGIDSGGKSPFVLLGSDGILLPGRGEGGLLIKLCPRRLGLMDDSIIFETKRIEVLTTAHITAFAFIPLGPSTALLGGGGSLLLGTDEGTLMLAQLNPETAVGISRPEITEDGMEEDSTTQRVDVLQFIAPPDELHFSHITSIALVFAPPNQEDKTSVAPTLLVACKNGLITLWGLDPHSGTWMVDQSFSCEEGTYVPCLGVPPSFSSQNQSRVWIVSNVNAFHIYNLLPQLPSTVSNSHSKSTTADEETPQKQVRKNVATRDRTNEEEIREEEEEASSPYKAQQQTIKKLLGSIEVLERDLIVAQEIQQSLTNTIHTNSASHTKEVNDLQLEVENKEKRIQSLEIELKKAKDTTRPGTDEILSSTEKEQENIKAVLADKEKEISSLQRALTQVQTSANEALTEQSQSLNTELDNREQIISQLKIDLEELQRSMEESKASSEANSRDAQRQKEGEYSSSQQQQRELEQQDQFFQEEIGALQSELDFYRSRVDELEENQHSVTKPQNPTSSAYRAGGVARDVVEEESESSPEKVLSTPPSKLEAGGGGDHSASSTSLVLQSHPSLAGFMNKLELFLGSVLDKKFAHLLSNPMKEQAIALEETVLDWRSEENGQFVTRTLLATGDGGASKTATGSPQLVTPHRNIPLVSSSSSSSHQLPHSPTGASGGKGGGGPRLTPELLAELDKKMNSLHTDLKSVTAEKKELEKKLHQMEEALHDRDFDSENLTEKCRRYQNLVQAAGAELSTKKVQLESREAYINSLLATIDCLYMDQVAQVNAAAAESTSVDSRAASPEYTAPDEGEDYDDMLAGRMNSVGSFTQNGNATGGASRVQSKAVASAGADNSRATGTVLRSPAFESSPDFRPLGGGRTQDSLVEETESLRVQVRFLEQVLRGHSSNTGNTTTITTASPTVGGYTPRNQTSDGDFSPGASSSRTPTSNQILTASYLRIRDCLGVTQANRILLTALRGDISDEVGATQRLIECLCAEISSIGSSSSPQPTSSGLQGLIGDF